MIISIINHTSGLLSDAEVQTAIRAINRQIAEDFEPQWNMRATLRLEGHGVVLPSGAADDLQHVMDMRGDAVIYLWHPMQLRIALGYHARNFLGVPFGFVFPALARVLGEPWTTTLSHEALEMIADPEVNMLVMGPHPKNPAATVFHWYEVCDAVQQEFYKVDGVPVSNFVLPLYFTSGDERASRNDFLGLVHGGKKLRSFGVNPGSYIGFYNPQTSQHEVYFYEGDTESMRRLTHKAELGLARRSRRYQAMTDRGPSITSSLRQYLGGD